MKRILAVTACPTGIAHTYMAAEALQQAAAEKQIAFKVETRGAIGLENELTAGEIAEAHAIIIAADTDVAEQRFDGKPVVKVGAAEAIKNPEVLLARALAMTPAAPAAPAAVPRPAGREKKTGPYQHLMTGVSYMLPLVVAGGLLIALSFVFGIEAFKEQGTMAAALMDIGGGAAFALMVPVLAGFISFSIAEKPGLAPGLIGGMLAANLGAGFIGGIFAGFLAGYVVRWMKKVIKLPKHLAGLTSILIIPLFASAFVGVAMIYVIGGPVSALMKGLSGWLTSLGTGNALLLGFLLGAMMAFDMGGPVNKAAYTFGVGLLGSNIYGPMAAVMAGGMTPVLGLWLATVLRPKQFTAEELEAGKAAGVLGLSFITEGAIPFAAADPFRIIPALVIGSGIAGALSMAFEVSLRTPHGGLFVLLIPNAVSQWPMYLLAIIAGTAVTAVLVSLLKRKKAVA
ncbi:PTS transporter subunit EIIC|uniref:PTS system D-fructose-specific IIB component (F1P-forming), Frc family /PTS system D-fructose-specific IIC component (F1P-forming), Frc family n=1 Tax=Dendrosporobacter quercicolus TaxID=146817 RepID=A0A1G9W4Y5_9FIRM|nr:fructose-specific PTS transporter subunit EIIC [Dendrosporobacter quercicolus]NSL47717.1 PTS transporter subunit EIIC [Dendrosporobacter quercicolus DSM 1736]SDM79622.1 PTS system D-fructose-specific IIB component (F1P-forming), Frc family /PTS system D-fructose-specific IIC component (F1P-forming), Frc family [Dendrosporobacter quercicolus]